MKLRIVYGFCLDDRYKDCSNELRRSPHFCESLLEELIYYYTEVYIILSDGSHKLLGHFDNSGRLDVGKNGYSYREAKDYAEKQAVLYNCKAEYLENVRDGINGNQ